MKRITTGILVVLFAISFASCRKEKESYTDDKTQSKSAWIDETFAPHGNSSNGEEHTLPMVTVR